MLVWVEDIYIPVSLNWDTSFTCFAIYIYQYRYIIYMHLQCNTSQSPLLLSATPPPIISPMHSFPTPFPPQCPLYMTELDWTLLIHDHNSTCTAYVCKHFLAHDWIELTYFINMTLFYYYFWIWNKLCNYILCMVCVYMYHATRTAVTWSFMIYSNDSHYNESLHYILITIKSCCLILVLVVCITRSRYRPHVGIHGWAWL